MPLLLQYDIRTFFRLQFILNSYHRFACWVKTSADDILKYFSYFSQKKGFHISCKLSPRRQFACNVKSCFLRKVRENVTKLSAAQLTQRVVEVKHVNTLKDLSLKYASPKIILEPFIQLYIVFLRIGTIRHQKTV